jgi:putative transposase
MYARGMSTRDIQAHVQEMYGVEISPTLISDITDGITEQAKAWQNWPLEPFYAIVFLGRVDYAQLVKIYMNPTPEE